MAELELEKMRVMVENASDLTSEARGHAEKARDYYDGYQWTAEEIAILDKRKQPVITINRIKRKVDAMVGLEQSQRTDPRAYARNPEDQQAAEAATAALVFVEDNTTFDVKASQVFENVCVEGYGGVEVGVQERGGKMEITVDRFRWEELFYDPHSRERDFSDATFMGCMKWMTVEQAEATYAQDYEGEEDLRDLLETSYSTTKDGETYDDRPQGETFRWGDKGRKRVRVVQMYYQSAGVWYLTAFCSGGTIYNRVSPYVDEDGTPTNPMILFSAYVDRENRRYGVVHDMFSAQDEINKRRSKLLHQLNSRQFVAVKGALDSIEATKRELAQPDGVVLMNIDAFEDARAAGVRPFEILENIDQVSGQFNLLTESKGEIDMLGPNASLLGQLQGQQSGRAIMAQQQAGMAELQPLYDAKRDWRVRCYRAMWERIRQYWTEERWVRITDDLGAPQYVGFNTPVQTPEGFPAIDQMGQPVRQNEPARMDMDIIIDEAPNNITLQQEQFEQLVNLAQSGAPIPMEIIVEASNLPNKAEVIQKMTEANAQNGQMQQQMQAMQMQFQQMQAQLAQMQGEAKARRDMAAAEKDMASTQKIAAEVEKVRSETVENYADAAKTQREAAVVGQTPPPGYGR